MIIYYAVFTFLLFWMTSFIGNLDFTKPGIRFISIIRDIFRFSLILNIVIIALCFVRAIGFDITKFDFKKDILDLGVAEKDNEEYEFEFKLDKDKIKSQIKKRIRYFKYFYKENKFIFQAISIVLILIFALGIVKMISNIEKVYKENEYFETENYKSKVVESFKTRYDTSGKKLNSKYFYIITKLEYQNKTSFDLTVNTNNLKIGYGDHELATPITNENQNFTEFGVNYFSQIVKPHEMRKFNFIFEIPIEYYNDSFKLKYLYNTEYVDNELKYNYKIISLNPSNLDDNKSSQVSVVNLNDEMSFGGSILGNTKLVIEDVSLNDIFYYNITKCADSKCVTRNSSVNATDAGNFDLTLLRIKYKLDYDYDKLGQKYSNDLFFSKLGSIRFEVNGKEYNNRLELVDVTPYSTKDFSILEVRDKLKKADKIFLDFNVRGKIYTYIIKDNTIKEGE